MIIGDYCSMLERATLLDLTANPLTVPKVQLPNQFGTCKPLHAGRDSPEHEVPLLLLVDTSFPKIGLERLQRKIVITLPTIALLS